jgi:hypothetical protein
MHKRAILALEDGTIYEGFAFGADAPAYGEGIRRFLPIRPTPVKLFA